MHLQKIVKKCCVLHVAMMLLALPQALAHEPDVAHFVDFTGMNIDGHLARPTVFVMESHQRARFERLLSLKKSMRNAMNQSTQDPTLR